MNKKPALSLTKKQLGHISIDSIKGDHSLSRKKKYLTVVTPSHLISKPIKSLKEIKNIAFGIKESPIKKPNSEIIVKKQVLHPSKIPSFISQDSWKRDLTLDLKPLQLSQNCGIEASARTMDTRILSIGKPPQTPINRLLFSAVSEYDQ